MRRNLMQFKSKKKKQCVPIPPQTSKYVPYHTRFVYLTNVKPVYNRDRTIRRISGKDLKDESIWL